VQAGADPDARDEHGHTPARVAGMHSHREVVELLLRRGGDGGAATAAAGASAGAADGAQSLDDFLASSRAALREREARAAAAAPAAPAASSRSASSAVRIPQPEVPDEGLADTFKRKGNEFFVAGDYEGAAKLYELALSHWTQ
jgi:ankyrin repeat protein